MISHSRFFPFPVSRLPENRLLLILCCFLCVLTYGCGVYSFTGASISPDVKTVSIQYFPNNAAVVQPILSQQFTEKLKEKFISQTSLALVDNSGDLQFEGAITAYDAAPTAIQGNETAALNRLTIRVNVKFTNTKDEKQNFETTFSRYADYDSKLTLSSVEQELISQINTQLVDDIFNKAVVNW
jgi:hypothetical protein